MDAIVDYLLNFYGPVPYLIVFGVLLACGLGLPIPEDITLIIAGLLAYYGLCHLGIMIGVCLAGVMLGDSLVFWLGEKYGRALTKKWFFRKVLPDERLDAARRQFRRHGNKLILVARFMPGLRAPIFFSAGILHLPFRTFFTYDGIAALLSVPAIVGGVYFFGDEIDHFIKAVRRFEHGVLAAVLLVAAFLTLKWARKRRARREGEGGEKDSP